MALEKKRMSDSLPPNRAIDDLAAIEFGKAKEYRALANNFDGYISATLHEMADAYEQRGQDILKTV
jgi:hypothetical protein